MQGTLNWLRRWETLLGAVLLVVIILNISLSPVFLNGGNLINLFGVSVEKIILALMMAFIIINGEIDLSVASIMALVGCLCAYLTQQGTPFEAALIISFVVGVLCGVFNGVMVAYVGLPSLAVTLAGLISYRGIARILLEDRSISAFPTWFTDLGNTPILGPLPFAVVLFFALFVIASVVLHYTAFGRYVFVIGNNPDAARMSGVDVRRMKLTLFTLSGAVAALAGLLYVARLSAVRANLAEGFELEAITMVLLGGVSIFGGSGTMLGVGLSILTILSLRNGMSLAGVTGNVQTSVIGLLLILSVLIPNLVQSAREWFRRRGSARASGVSAQSTTEGVISG
ncbi:MAG: ABC transporter permease [Anaerolineae bacterium]